MHGIAQKTTKGDFQPSGVRANHWFVSAREDLSIKKQQQQQQPNNKKKKKEAISARVQQSFAFVYFR